LPFHIGRLRLKRDIRLTAHDAEDLLKPSPVDLNAPYGDLLINLGLITITFWISPGRYQITLWLALAGWAVLQGLVYHMNVLRWQALTYFGGNDSHECASLLMAIPLAILAAKLESQSYPTHSGIITAALHFTSHIIFVRYVLPTVFSRYHEHVSLGTTFDEMMQDRHAPMANYRNTNPIEVLKRVYVHKEEIAFYRHDKWYLQLRHMGADSVPKGSLTFQGEDSVHERAQGLVSDMKSQAKQIIGDAKEILPTNLSSQLPTNMMGKQSTSTRSNEKDLPTQADQIQVQPAQAVPEEPTPTTQAGQVQVQLTQAAQQEPTPTTQTESKSTADEESKPIIQAGSYS
jgi:hypothetical protein